MKDQDCFYLQWSVLSIFHIMNNGKFVERVDLFQSILNGIAEKLEKKQDMHVSALADEVNQKLIKKELARLAEKLRWMANQVDNIANGKHNGGCGI